MGDSHILLSAGFRTSGLTWPNRMREGMRWRQSKGVTLVVEVKRKASQWLERNMYICTTGNR